MIVIDKGASWPKREEIEPELIPYWRVRSFLTLKDELILYGSHIVIPTSLREEMMEKVHAGHQGIERCHLRVNSSVWWPGIVKQVTEMIQQCYVCAQEAAQKREPLIISLLLDYPWQVIGTDLFELKGASYLLIVDYFSRHPEIAKLTSTTSQVVIIVLKSIFARHGIPEVIQSDNGPQYASQDFTHFAKLYGFQHLTSSPHYPQSNGQAERTVQTVRLQSRITKNLSLSFHF